MLKTQKIELLSPAKNLQFGKEAINHGADAVYIGAPAFGARQSAGNSLHDIETLVQYAHLFKAKVYVTVNTLLFDNELDDANLLLHQLYNAGADAAIIQDLGLLETPLPPMALHASTQANNVDVRRIQFFEQIGIQRVILARELSLQQIADIRKQTSVELEAFVQGALCVSYSGQCYLSQYLNGRSGNRGCCSQPCRSSYNLYNSQNQLLVKNKHLLSLKDFSAATHLAQLLQAGVCSFKIEGRLKDLCYVKNITAYYRKLIDNLLEEKRDFSQSSSGKTIVAFTPDPERTFNRGFTDYFLCQRQKMASFSTQKSVGKVVGTISKTTADALICHIDEPIVPGDGLCFQSPQGDWQGFLVNKVIGNKLIPNKMLAQIKSGAKLFRNNDFEFEKQLQSDKSSVRKIGVELAFDETPQGFSLTATDEDGIAATALTDCDKQRAQNPEKALQNIETQLLKTGQTAFLATRVENRCTQPYFVPASVLNDLRRRCLQTLEQQRITIFQPADTPFVPNNAPYYEKKLYFNHNVLNSKAMEFYKRHGAEVAEWGLEKTLDYTDKPLMTTKYCIRYELGQCLKNNELLPQYRSSLYLENNGQKLRLQFDCKNCRMQIFAE